MFDLTLKIKEILNMLRSFFFFQNVIYSLGKEFGTEEGVGTAAETGHSGELRRRDPTPRPPTRLATRSGTTLQ